MLYFSHGKNAKWKTANTTILPSVYKTKLKQTAAKKLSHAWHITAATNVVLYCVSSNNSFVRL